MKLHEKISKIGDFNTYRRIWRRAQRQLHPIPLSSVTADVDQARLREIQRRYADSEEHYAKYLNLARFLRLNRERVQDLNLHRASPQRILDLGCGAGYFLFICKHYGHSVLGLDTGTFPLFGEMTELFGVPRKIHAIKPFNPLPELSTRFDWITGFSTSFNCDPRDREPWGPPEWNFLLDDLTSRLAQGGKVIFGLNSGKYGDFYTPELRDFFERRGAEVERHWIFFKNGIREAKPNAKVSIL